jgi:hypothetical protein
MTKEEAHHILDTQKDGSRLHPFFKINDALRKTGDIGRKLPIHTRPFSEDGINDWLESTGMAQGAGTRESHDRDMEGNKSGFNQQNEGNQ